MNIQNEINEVDIVSYYETEMELYSIYERMLNADIMLLN